MTVTTLNILARLSIGETICELETIITLGVFSDHPKKETAIYNDLIRLRG